MEKGYLSSVSEFVLNFEPIIQVERLVTVIGGNTVTGPNGPRTDQTTFLTFLQTSGYQTNAYAEPCYCICNIFLLLKLYLD